MTYKKYQFSSFVYFAGKGERPSGEAPEKAKEQNDGSKEKPEQEEGAAEKGSAGARIQLGSLRVGAEVHYSTKTKTGASAVVGWTF